MLSLNKITTFGTFLPFCSEGERTPMLPRRPCTSRGWCTLEKNLDGVTLKVPSINHTLALASKSIFRCVANTRILLRSPHSAVVNDKRFLFCANMKSNNDYATHKTLQKIGNFHANAQAQFVPYTHPEG